jgi:hypothetical protein
LGIVDLQGTTVEAIEDRSGRKFLFHIAHHERRTYIISAPTEEDRQDWIRALRKFTRPRGEEEEGSMSYYEDDMPPKSSPRSKKKKSMNEHLLNEENKMLASAAIMFQSFIRMWHVQKALEEARPSAVVLQTSMRAFQAQREFTQLRKASLVFQSSIRAYLDLKSQKQFSFVQLFLSFFFISAHLPLSFTKKKKVSRAKKRRAVVEEILTTENTYCEYLMTVEQVYKNPT